MFVGSIRYDSRDYVIVEVKTDDGLIGTGVGMARYAPVQSVVARNLAPLLIGQEAHQSEALWERMYFTNLLIGQRGILMRGLSILDIALWDLKSKAAGLPLWALLGGCRSSAIPALMAGGYADANRTLDEFDRELRGYVDRGFRWIKIAGGALGEDARRLDVARSAIGQETRLAYDAHSDWRVAHEVIRIVRSWEPYQLEWIEDPFPSDFGASLRRLRDAVPIPLALGEAVVGRCAFRDLLREDLADIIRVDATTAGGVSEAIRVCALAAAESKIVSPHIFPELHVHLAAAYANVPMVEVTDPDQHIDVLFRLLRRPLAVVDGVVSAPVEPGIGLEIDWTAAEPYLRSVEVVEGT